MTIHLATSLDLGRIVRRGLHAPVAFVPDNWLVGPFPSAPDAHPALRCDYWGFQGRARAHFLGAFREVMEALESSERLVLWTVPRWDDAVALWAFCAFRLVHWPQQPDVDLVVLGGGGNTMPTPAVARLCMGQAQTLSLPRLRQMALFWRKLSGRSPILSGKGKHAGAGRKTLVELGGHQAGFFPRLETPGLGLSRFDALLFSCLERGGSTPVEVFMRRGPDGEELRRWVCLTGDVFLANRLSQWAKHGGAGAALLADPHQLDNVMKAARYQLSDLGQGILRHGLGDMARGAPLPMWGITAYDPRAPWVVVEDPAGQPRLQRFA